jgi:hypothetical protein
MERSGSIWMGELGGFSQVIHRCPRRSRREGAEASFTRAMRQGKMPKFEQLYFPEFAHFRLLKPRIQAGRGFAGDTCLLRVRSIHPFA